MLFLLLCVFLSAAVFFSISVLLSNDSFLHSFVDFSLALSPGEDSLPFVVCSVLSGSQLIASVFVFFSAAEL